MRFARILGGRVEAGLLTDGDLLIGPIGVEQIGVERERAIQPLVAQGQFRRARVLSGPNSLSSPPKNVTLAPPER